MILCIITVIGDVYIQFLRTPGLISEMPSSYGFDPASSLREEEAYSTCLMWSIKRLNGSMSTTGFKRVNPTIIGVHCFVNNLEEASSLRNIFV
jgi:hypothetical protein